MRDILELDPKAMKLPKWPPKFRHHVANANPRTLMGNGHGETVRNRSATSHFTGAADAWINIFIDRMKWILKYEELLFGAISTTSKLNASSVTGRLSAKSNDSIRRFYKKLRK